MLHIINGSAAIPSLRMAFPRDDFLPWDDVLHEGPCSLLPNEEFATLRARFIHGRGWGEFDEILARFRQRDKALAQAAGKKSMVLWSTFELYDQLHLIQILARCSNEGYPAPMLIFPDAYLGMMGPEEALEWFDTRQPATDQQLVLATHAWKAFCRPDPEQFVEMLEIDTACLPFLGAAISRMLAEFPHPTNGLSLTQQYILETLDKGPLTPGALFRGCRTRENPAFMGDWSFWVMVERLITGGLVQTDDQQSWRYEDGIPQQKVSLTKRGERVLSGHASLLDYNSPDFWIGGVHVCPPRYHCWNPDQQELVYKEIVP